jgi:hypothetical protein
VRNDDEEWGGRAGLGRASRTGEGEALTGRHR